MKIVIVGAGRGLGHVLAQMLAEKGHTVVAGLRRLDDTISERENLIYLQMDATDEGQIRDAVQWTKHHVGEIDAVVYVAGILLQSDRTETLLTESLDEGSLFPAYGVSKTTANKIIQTLRVTVGESINVYAVHPGRMNTDMGRTTAQIEPEEAAIGFCNILEGTTHIEKDQWFIDYRGNAMPL